MFTRKETSKLKDVGNIYLNMIYPVLFTDPTHGYKGTQKSIFNLI